MMKRCCWVLFLVAAFAAHSAADARQSVGLVLSGGGAKGIAHIGVIQALEENDIPIDYVTGTSMGAIVGSLYAMGFTPADMMELITSREFGYWSTGTIDPSLSAMSMFSTCAIILSSSAFRLPSTMSPR